MLHEMVDTASARKHEMDVTRNPTSNILHHVTYRIGVESILEVRAGRIRIQWKSRLPFRVRPPAHGWDNAMLGEREP